MFDQETYEVRVDAEADLMIALEALKNEVKDLTTGFHTLEANIHHAMFLKTGAMRFNLFLYYWELKGNR